MNMNPANETCFLSRLLLGCAFFLASCGGDNQDADEGCTPAVANSPQQTRAEIATCTSAIFSGGVVVSGQALYQYRPVTIKGLGTAANKPIRHAEIRVTDAGGALIQCGTTDGAGNFSLNLPQNTAGMTLAVNSRIAGNAGYASVLSDHCSGYYSITAPVTTGGANLQLGTLSAAVDHPGGAFNILDRIVDANTYLAQQVTGDNCKNLGCSPFPNNQKVSIYWKLGKNPAEYYGSDSALSFYVPTARQLYILGGQNGNYTTADTDHYDNSVIVHEYAHFIEDVYSKTDSPGGMHSADGTIDARLAFGEGLANFFQGTVLKESCRTDESVAYCDTRGNPLGSTGLLINYGLENQDTVDMPVASGEGNFREFSIARFLFDMVDSAAEAGDAADTLSFSHIWAVLTGSSFLNPSTKFRNMGLFHEIYRGLAGRSDLSSLYSLHKHDSDQREYGVTLKSNDCQPRVIGTPDTHVLGDFASSNHHSANDFFRYYHSGGSLQVRLDYTTNPTFPVDLDLYIYRDGYVFGNEQTVAAFSEQYHPTASATASETASGTLVAGDYMINVRQYQFVKDSNQDPQKATYSLKINGVDRCPSY